MKKRIKNFFEKYKFWLLILTGLGIFIDVFFLNSAFDLLILFLAIMWILTIWLNKFEGRVSVGGALVFLIMCPFLLIFGKEAIAEKAAIWAYLFLVVGVIQLVIKELKD